MVNLSETGVTDSNKVQPKDLQVVEGWDYDEEQVIFVQWLSGPGKFFNAELNWEDTVDVWRAPTATEDLK